ncbi:hypothetical protein NIES22_61600 [Calothrix brevissima NIES-22]|nr:hypothetical protein NIES22_61600 [Calothrix brevissima NIES-22]
MFTQVYLLKKPIISKVISLISVLSFATIVANTTPAAAVQVKYSSPGNVSKIEDLVVDNISYEITFKYDSFVNLFGSPNSSNFQTPTFWNNPEGAKNLVDSIVVLLNSQQQPVPTQINNYPSGLVPYRGIVGSNDVLYIVSKVNHNYGQEWVNFLGETQDVFPFGNEQANYAILNINKSSHSVPEGNMLPSAIVAFFLMCGITLKRKKWQGN